jgi:hypothetical protein
MPDTAWLERTFGVNDGDAATLAGKNDNGHSFKAIASYIEKRFLGKQNKNYGTHRDSRGRFKRAR